MRRLVTIAVIGALSFLSQASHAQVSFTLTPPTTNTTQGSQVCLDVVVTNFTDIVSLQYSINYNAAVLEFDMAQNFNLPGFTAANVGNPSAGNLTISWLANDVVLGQSVANGTSIFEICFTAIAANATSNVSFSGTPTPIEVTNPNGILNPVFNNATVIVGSGGGGGGSTDLTFIASNESGPTGSQVCVDISVLNFTDMVSMQYSINYNSSVLQFASATGFNLPGMGVANVGNPTPGNISISWVANDPLNGETVADGTVIFQLCFNITGANGSSSNIGFSGAPVPVEVIDVDGPLTPVFDNGLVTVTAGGGGGNNNLTFTASDETGGNGDQVCVDVTVQNFTNIVSMQYSINYNSSVLQFTGGANFNLPGFTGASIGNPTPGNITISWLANDPVAGQSVANGTVIYQLCFNITGASGTSSNITFSGSPTPVEISTPNGIVNPTFDNGSVTVTSVIGVDDFAIILSNANIESGVNVCIDMSVQNFTEMVSMQFSINYPGNLLSYTGAQNFTLPGLTGASIGNPGGAASGNLTLSWLANDVVLGETVPDGTVIAQLCFTATGPNCSTADIVFSGTPTPVEVTDVDGNVVFNWDGSTIVICDTEPLNLSASDETVAPGDNTCVHIRTVDGFTNIKSMQFSLAYDPAILDYTNVASISLSGFTAADVANPVAGQITIDWDSPSPAGTTVPDNTILFDLCFDAIGSSGDVSPVNFTGSPLAILVENPNSPVPFMGDDGSVTLDEACPPIEIQGTMTNSCAGAGTGTIDITVTGGNDTYSYEWDNGETSEDLGSLSAGTYTVTVTSCSATASMSFTVASFPAINITPTIVDVACFGDNSGAIFLTIQGSGPFSYLWSGPGTISNPTGQNISNLIAGNYTVTVTDGNGCIKTANILVKQPNADLTASLLSVTPVSCFGESDGAIQVQVLGGTLPYTYNWTPSLPGIPNPSGIPAGTYNLQVIDANSCTVSIVGIQVAQPQNLVVNLVNLVNETGAGNNGSIDISVSGGTSPFSYLWSGPGGPYITQDINNLTSGTYTLVVTDDNGCTATFSATIIKPLQIILDDVNHPCGGLDDGSISISLEGGDDPFAFFWSGPGGPYFTEDLSGLGGGLYSLTVTDFVGTQAFLQVTLVEPVLPLDIANATVINPSGPNTCDGAIVLNSVVGGTPPYSFYWSNTAVTPSIFNLCSAPYSVTITDDNGCTFEETFNLQFIPLPIFLDFNGSENVKCNGGEDGVWTVSIEGGVSPYTFSYSDTFATLSVDGEVTRNDLAAGFYSVTITDSYVPPQEIIVTRTINQPNALSLISTLIYPATGVANNGAVNITALGGTLPYNYQWSNGFQGPDPAGLGEACYNLTVADNHGCIYSFNDICVPSFEVSGSSITDNFCNSDAEGAISITVEGGINEPLVYTWIGPNGPVPNPDSNQVNNLPPGDYTVYVTDALGVTTVAEILTIGFTSEVVAEASATTDYNGYDVSCPDNTDGGATVIALDGVSPFTYQWLGGLGSQPSVDQLGEGTYYAVVTDALGCKDTAAVTLSAPPPVGFQPEITQVSCTGDSDGKIMLKILGGLGGELSYQWDDSKNQETNPAIFLNGGIYSVTITDENGCEQVASFEVDEPPLLQVSLVSTPDDGSANGTLTATPSGGTAPYIFQWTTGRPGDTGDFVNDLASGEYDVLVTDANNCTAIASGFVANGSIECLEFRNVITPDGDGMNEYFQINCLNLYEQNFLQIFNRWGQLVYEADNYQNDWAGVNRLGEDLPEGAYFFVFEYQDEQGAMQQIKGHITLIR